MTYLFDRSTLPPALYEKAQAHESDLTAHSSNRLDVPSCSAVSTNPAACRIPMSIPGSAGLKSFLVAVCVHLLDLLLKEFGPLNHVLRLVLLVSLSAHQ